MLLEPHDSSVGDDRHCLEARVVEHSSRDRRKCDGPELALPGGIEGRTNGLLEEGSVVLIIAVTRANHVDHVARLKSAPGRHSGLAGAYRPVFTHPLIRLFLNDGAPCAHDRRSDAASVTEIFVGSIDDGVDPLLGQVTLNHKYAARTRSSMRDAFHTARLRPLRGPLTTGSARAQGPFP